MRPLVLTSLTMVAFAANSVLNRLALTDPAMGPAAFAAIRLISGAAILSALVLLRSNGGLRPGALGTAMLALYMVGFSFAYLTLDAGIGALILFGGVQITMFAGAVIGREVIPAARWFGALIAFSGLVYLLWPGAVDAANPAGAALMAAAAFGWGLYSLAGRATTDPLAATGGNFLAAAPIGILVWAVWPDGVTATGAALAVLSGAVTSGLGYALWYTVLPRLDATTAAVAQLTVPVIALAGGAIFLSESLTWRFAIATILVLGGVLISLRPAVRR